MRNKHAPVPPESPTNEPKTQIVATLHTVVCVACVLVLIFFLFRCCSAFYKAIPSPLYDGEYGLMHFLYVHLFAEKVQVFMAVLAEFLAYVILYKRAENKKKSLIALICFSIMFLLHTAIWFHARSLVFPDVFELNRFDSMRREYYLYGQIAMWPSVAYLIMFLIRRWQISNDTAGKHIKPKAESEETT